MVLKDWETTLPGTAISVVSRVSSTITLPMLSPDQSKVVDHNTNIRRGHAMGLEELWLTFDKSCGDR